MPSSEKKSILQFEITKKKVAQGHHAFLPPARSLRRAGVPVMEALEVISEETTDKLLKSALDDMTSACRPATPSPRRPARTRSSSRPTTSGSSLGRADRQPRHGARPTRRLPRARDRSPRKVTSALIYPAVVAVMAGRHRGRPGRVRAARVRDLLQVLQRQAAPADPDAAQRLGLRHHLVVAPSRSSSSWSSWADHRHASVTAPARPASTPSS